MTESVYLLAKRLEADVIKSLARADPQSFDVAMRKLLTGLRREATDARLDVRDYEFAETRAEQFKLGTSARKRLETVRKGILAASQHDIFGVVEVAELSARIDHLFERLD